MTDETGETQLESLNNPIMEKPSNPQSQLFEGINKRTNELLLTPDAISMDPHPLLSEMGERNQNLVIKQAVYKNGQTNTSFLIESGPLNERGDTYITIDWLTQRDAKGVIPGGWIKVIQYEGDRPPNITSLSDLEMTQEKRDLWQRGRAHDLYNHNTFNPDHALREDEANNIIDQLKMAAIDPELTVATAAYSEFDRAEKDFVATAVAYWRASESGNPSDIQKARERFEHAERIWNERKKQYTPQEMKFKLDVVEEQTPVQAEVVPLSEDRVKQTLLDLVDIDLRLKSAKENGIVSDYSFRETIKGYISIEYTTCEGVHMMFELGDINNESKPNALQNQDLNYMGVRSYTAHIAETGKSFNMLEPPFLTNPDTVLAINVKEPNHSSLSEITPDDINNLTPEGIRFLFRKFRDTKPKYYPAQNIAAYNMPFTLIEAATGLHEAGHVEDQQTSDFEKMYKLWRSRKTVGKPKELFQQLANIVFTTEDHANTEAITRIKHLTAGMKDQSRIVKNIALMSGFAMRTYLNGFESIMDPALLLSKKDYIYGIKSTDVVKFDKKVTAGISADTNLYLRGASFSDVKTDSIFTGIMHEKEEQKKHKPTWTSLAITFLRSCIKSE